MLTECYQLDVRILIHNTEIINQEATLKTYMTEPA